MIEKRAHTAIIKELLIGFCLGTANIIPGVSGGTFLLIFKIYERVFSILNKINKANIIYSLNSIVKIVFKGDKKNNIHQFTLFLTDNDFIFLGKLLIGSVVAILSLSSLMKYLIINHFSVTYALFFGLIFTSIIIPVKMLTDKKPYMILFFVLGVVLTVYVTAAVNPYEKAKMKSDHYQQQYVKTHDRGESKQAPDKSSNGETGIFSFTGKYTVEEYSYAAVCGAFSISAMVLPGISGSLVLILLGEYFEVISAISGLRTLSLDYIAFLGCFSLGIVLGGLLFARLVNAILKRYYNATMVFLIGLMAGSLYALWPFKKSMVLAEQYVKKDGVIQVIENARIFTNMNEVPQIGTEVYLSMVSFAIGCLIMFFFVKKETRQ